MRTRDMGDIHVVGRACRLPSAPSVAQFWQALDAGQSCISTIPPDRWQLDRYFDPRPGTPGKYYTLAAGVLDPLWTFDPSVFGISPREAVQLDPQQRLCLKLTWEALEDAGLPPSVLAGRNVAVYAGASSLDYGTARMFDAAGADAYFMIGNTLSLIANRVSHAFDLNGPSLTVDTACSSSLVALHHAVEALAAGQVEAAIVLGVNVLASPFSYIGFSQARMLSPEGVCRPFDADGNGYVRAEGAVALLLTRRDSELPEPRRAHCRIVATGINSDGHTIGVSLPSADRQAQLLEEVYRSAAIDPAYLAFVEAHGTGTRVGDPAEADALGRALATRRPEPLVIGSVKSNIGHLEPASGLAGLLKAMLALEHDRLPRSLHFTTPNPDIPFETLNLRVASEAVALSRGHAPRYAGINSFGFGGTNAHAIIADPQLAGASRSHPVAPPRRRRAAAAGGSASPIVVLSAASEAALADLASAHVKNLAAEPDLGVGDLAAALGHTRDLMPFRAAITATGRAGLEDALAAIAKSREGPGVVRGRAVARQGKTVLVLSGNGSQWAGMGRAALKGNSTFRAHFAEIDRIFTPRAGWSLDEALAADDLAERLRSTLVAQPLLFALQTATVAALADYGIAPDAVLGHSVGEVAAAHVSGAVSLEYAVDLIIARSNCQEPVRRLGSMATMRLGEKDAAAFIAECGIAGAEIAAINSAHSVTVSGVAIAVRQLCAVAESRGIATRQLDLEYPFHSSLMEPARQLLIDSLEGFEASASTVPFVSTVTGAVLDGRKLDANYWWDNVRRPVRFADAVATAAQIGGRVFIEIGPRPVLQSYVRECLASAGGRASMASLSPGDEVWSDPIRRTAAEAIVLGAGFDAETVFGPPPNAPLALPSYPWQRQVFRSARTVEAIASFGVTSPQHPLLGWPDGADGLRWRAHVDPVLIPWLADHRVDGHAVYPGAAYLETAVAAARAWLGTDDVVVRDLEILSPMIFREGETREVRVQITAESGAIELASRPRLTGETFLVHAVCRAGKIARSEDPSAFPIPAAWTGALDTAEVYAAAGRHGNDYGPAFRRVARVIASEPGIILIELDGAHASDASAFALDPRSLDAAFHGLFVRPGAMPEDGTAPLALLPIRSGEIVVRAPGRPIRYVRIDIRREGRQSLLVDINLAGADGEPIARIEGGRIARAALSPRPILAEVTYHEALEPLGADAEGDGLQVTYSDVVDLARRRRPDQEAVPAEPRLLLEAAAQRLAYDELWVATSEAPCAKLEDEDPHKALGPASAAQRREALFRWLSASGFATIGPEGWKLADDCTLPAAGSLIRTVLAEHPAWVAECALLQAVAQGQTPSAALLEHFLFGSPRPLDTVETIACLVAEACRARRRGPALRIAVVGASGSLCRRVLELIPDGMARLVLCDGDRRALEKARLAFAGDWRVSIVDLASADALTAAGPFDLAAAPFGLEAGGGRATAALRRAIRSGGPLIVADNVPDAFHDYCFGQTPGWFDDGTVTASPPRRGLTREDRIEALVRSGFDGVETVSATDDRHIVIARAAEARPSMDIVEAHSAPSGPAKAPIIVISDVPAREPSLTDPIVLALAHAGRDVTLMRSAASPDMRLATPPTGSGAPRLSKSAVRKTDETLSVGREVVLVIGTGHIGADVLAGLQGRCLALKEMLSGDTGSILRLWLVLTDGRGGTAATSPSLSALRSFARTTANEHPRLDIRIVMLDAGTGGDAIERLAAAINNAGTECEIEIGPDHVSALRIRPGRPSVRHSGRASAGDTRQRSVLAQGQRRALRSLSWQRQPLAAPGPGEVQIEVTASGLNFRDVMWAMGLLPEEALEDGFAGPTLGFECAGRISALGENVQDLSLGDAVIAMAPQALASHVIVGAAAVVRLPDNVPLAAAATIPVAYLTAHYALDHLARLKTGEWVLIHGGAGGVGLAALDIARAKGARVIATAGSADKRELLRLLGAEHVLSSRSLEFADEVKRIAGGIDVVLNSLSGAAMEASFGLLKPFGRFLELGKRDFYANTRLGLRPFRRNVSYFGIDADQLLAQDGVLAHRLMGELMDRFAAGDYRPLPYRLFAAGEVEDAFRLMQQSGHIGKILISPPDPDSLPEPQASVGFRASPDGAHVIVGGLGGFGLRTAVWLADHGARSIVLAGRSGRVAVAEKAIVSGLAGRGVDVEVRAADVTDRDALAALLDGVRARRPIKGIVHAAAVLDDELITNLDADSLARVLAPKVTGATLLDELTASDPLDYFLLYSSVSTLVGNPGQAAYVAANGYLEGLARRRRSQGRPALAVRWGAIADAGMLLRDTKTAATLARRTGAASLTARQALDLLSEALLSDTEGAEGAVITIAPMSWAAARAGLPLASTPLFADLAGAMEEAAVAGERIDLAAAVAGLDDGAAADFVAGHLASELAAILRMPAVDISIERPLPELGLDSLMAVELRLAVQRKLGVEIPMAALADGLTLGAIAERVLASLKAPVRDRDGLSLVTGLTRMHVAENLEREDIERLKLEIEKQGSDSDRVT